MADSLVINGQIELLLGGVPSEHPQAAGAIFYLGRDFDLSSPPAGAGDVANMLLPSDTGSNRTITLPVRIRVPSTGDALVDRETLAGARELLVEIVAQDEWPLTWTRDGGDPVIFDAFEAEAAVVDYSILGDKQLVSQLEVSFTTLPYGRSVDGETILFNAPSQNFETPPSAVTVDNYNTTTNFLTGDASTFEAGIANWVAAGSCTIARSTAIAGHGGIAELALTATAASSMTAAHCSPGNFDAFGMQCDPGDTITCKGWFRWAGGTGAARTVQVGAEFFDSLGNSLGDGLFGTGVADSSSAWTQATASVTAPASAAWARVKERVTGTLTVGEVHYVDDAWIDSGPVYSSDDPEQWISSTQTAVSGGKSARWSRTWRDHPIYDHVLAAPVDITGRNKIGLWLGLATSADQYPVWHKGSVHVSITLRDATSQTVSMSVKRNAKASGLQGKPHWQFVAAHIPQLASGFDYTTVSSYRLEIWNHWDSKAVGPTGQKGGRVLQSGAYLNALVASASSTGSPVTRGAWYTLPGIVGSAPAPVSLQAAPGPSSFSTVVEFTTAGSNAWTAPSGVTKVDKAEAWAGGGGGAGGSNQSGGGGGGGGGEYSREDNVTVVALGSFPVTVGAAGSGGSAGNAGTKGGDSFWSGSAGKELRAHGGNKGLSSNTWGGGKGGDGSTNYRHYSGGNGRQSNVNQLDSGRGGGGGGSAGPNSGGRDADGRPGASAVSGGGPGGDGGVIFGGGSTSGSAPTVGPGGGGGGGNDNSGGHAGGNGKVGKVRLSYGATGILALSSLLVHTPGAHAPDALSPLIPVGNGADTPNGATEYPVPIVGAINATFDGTYSIMLIAGTWNSPASSRDLTVTIRQYPFTGGVAVSQALTKTGVVPNTDVVNGYVDMGPVTLPLSQLPPGNITDAYFGITITSSNTADRFLDVLALDLAGRTALVNVPSASIFNNIWIDEPDHNRNLGGAFGSDADRDRAVSVFRYLDRISGGPFTVHPQQNNRMLVYAAQGCPALTVSYLPRWRLDRLQ